jgi:hypothetical protein
MKVLDHPLTDLSKPHVFVRFTDATGDHTFGSAINSLTGDRLSGFDNAAPSINDSKRWILSVVRDIQAKATVTEITNTFR